jgi:hypothetical protein
MKPPKTSELEEKKEKTLPNARMYQSKVATSTSKFNEKKNENKPKSSNDSLKKMNMKEQQTLKNSSKKENRV